MSIDLSGRVAIVTGAGGGLGREHALLLAKRGAKLVINDLGPGLDGDPSTAEAVVNQIVAAGGEAMANHASVADREQVQALVAAAMERWGRVDILVNNAGILRDKSFAKMDLDDFRLVLDVHLMGAVYCCKAVWDIMRAQNYGRIVLTTSSTGLYGNFGQSNYGAAKMALVGLMQTLAIEGQKNNVRVNCIAPTASTRMMEGLLAPELVAALKPELVSPGVLALVADNAPTRTILCAGGGSFEQAHITLTRGIYVGAEEDAADQVAARLNEIGDTTGASIPEASWAQGRLELKKAGHLVG